MNANQTIGINDAGRDAEQHPLSPYESAQAWTYSWINATERLADLAARATQTLLAEQRAVTFAMLEEQSPFSVWRLQTDYALTGTAKSVAYARHASEIVLGTIADAVTAAESRISRNFFGATEAIEHVAHDAATATVLSVQSGPAAMDSATRIVDASGNALPSDGTA